MTLSESSTRSGSSTDVASLVKDPVFEVENTDVVFGMDRGESRVLDNVNMAIERGEILGIVGESGSGKSMFASALLDAVVEPGRLSGEITFYPSESEPINVLDLSDEALRQFRWEKAAMVFQGAMSAFNPTITIQKHFKETLTAHNTDVDEGMDRARQLLSDLYLNPDTVLHSYPHELSGGMKQRGLIALAMVLDPDVLIMDEPTAALDLLMQRSIIDLMEQIKEKYNITIVFITHDITLVSELADRLAVMYAFQFVEVGPTDQILKEAAHPYTRALLKAIPNLETPLEEMRPIDGSAPDPVNVPSGCAYHPRCPLATEECVDADPEYFDAGPGHQVACFHWEEAAEAIPFTPGSNGSGSDE